MFCGVVERNVGGGGSAKKRDRGWESLQGSAQQKSDDCSGWIVINMHAVGYRPLASGKPPKSRNIILMVIMALLPGHRILRYIPVLN
jgi:hypothetical protein